MSKNLPILDPGWVYLYLAKYHSWVELSDGRTVYVGQTDGTRVICHTDKDGWFFISGFAPVKLLDNNKKKEKKKNEMRLVPSNTKSGRTKA